MKILLQLADKDKWFAKQYLPVYILKSFIDLVDTTKLNMLASNLKSLNLIPKSLDLFSLIKYVLSNLLVSNTDDMYIIYIDKNLKVNGEPCVNIINLITYGSLSVKGYPILLEIFDYVQAHLREIYEGA